VLQRGKGVYKFVVTLDFGSTLYICNIPGLLAIQCHSNFMINSHEASRKSVQCKGTTKRTKNNEPTMCLLTEAFSYLNGRRRSEWRQFECQTVLMSTARHNRTAHHLQSRWSLVLLTIQRPCHSSGVFFFNSLSGGWSPTWSTRLGGHWLAYCTSPGDYDDGEFGGMKTGRGNRSTRRKPAPAPLCPPQIPLDQTRDRTRAVAVGSQWLTAWAMARPRLKSNYTRDSVVRFRPDHNVDCHRRRD
jgi:hypothetical protein